MNKTSTIRLASSALGFVALTMLAAACTATPDENNEAAASSRDDITTAMGNMPGAKIVAVDDDGVPTFISGDLGTMPAVRSMAASDVNPALPTVAPAFRATPAKLAFKTSVQDSIGDVHYRFTQKRNGKDVLGAELIVHTRKNNVYAANGNVREDLAEPAAAKLQPEQALSQAKAQITGVDDMTARVSGQLSYLQEGSTLRLVHPIEVSGTDAEGTPVRDTVLIDAVDGSIAQRLPQIMTAKVREMHDSKHTSSTPGALVRSEGGATVSDNIVNDNYDRLGSVYDCYKDMFGRDSYNNQGAKLVSSVHYSTNYVNAYWNGTQMVYGDGDGVNASNLAESMDVTAHELTHAVTASTSNLTYSGQSGGLNESISDIFGATCEYYQMGRTTVNPIIWAIGHDIWTPNGPSDDGLRYMNDPKKDGTSLDFAGDYAGQDVHYTSGVSNLAYTLLVNGGTHPRGKTNIQVTGIGIEKAAQIFYRANTTIFTASTNWASAKTATEQAATQLGYSADVVASVTAAWQAVGVGTPAGGTTGTGGTTGSSSSSSSSGGSTSGSTGGSCKHDVCTAGTKLPSSCSSCAAKVCAGDSYCCGTKWDSTCVSEVAQYCGQSCN